MMNQLRFAFGLSILAVMASLGLSSTAGATLPAMGQVAQDQRKICAEPIRHHEREAGIPNQLLAAVALAESGRWDKADSASFAWPWTVTAEGKGQFFATKAEAIAQVQRLRARGLRNIDVGCMQINLMHHPDAFANLEEALDPQANVAYATGFLKQLFMKHRSWIAAVGHYHSATPELHMRYRQKVTKLWNEARRRDAEERRQDTIAAYQQRRGAAERSNGIQIASADVDEAAEAGRIVLPQSAQKFASNGTAPAAGQRFAPLSSSAPSAPTSLRVISQIPTSTATRAPATAASTPGRILPRATMVPMERRY